jgi:energy-coupling factor transporter ATP-binding protein EcfA2
MRTFCKGWSKSSAWPRLSGKRTTLITLGVLVLAYSDLFPAPGDRAAFVGQTGSGKTTLAEMACRVRPYVVVLDPKGRIDWKGYTVHTTLADTIKASGESHRLVYKPTYDELQDEETLDRFFEWVYKRGNTTLYVDEIFAIAQGDQYPWHFGACLTRGRELGVSVYVATQRPARIPQVMLSESEHVYCFRLKLPQDQERMADITGLDETAIARLPKHHFYYAPQDGEARGPLTLALGGASTSNARAA